MEHCTVIFEQQNEVNRFLMKHGGSEVYFLQIIKAMFGACCEH